MTHDRCSGTRVVIVRPTRNVQRLLPLSDPVDAVSDGALGDWYVKKFVVDRRPLLLMMSSESLLSFLVPARDVRRLPDWLPSIVSTGLRRLEIDQRSIDAETATMTTVAVAGTKDRSVLGSLVEFCKLTTWSLPINGWDETSLRDVETFLQRTPCRCGRRAGETIWPIQRTRELMGARWST